MTPDRLPGEIRRFTPSRQPGRPGRVRGTGGTRGRKNPPRGNPAGKGRNTMANTIASPRGTQDVLPADSYRWQYVERTALDIARLYGFSEIRVPTFEHTELFNRGVGDTTDVVQKEMYTFLDKGGRSVSLRPEITAGVCRSVIQNGLLSSGVLPLGASYVASCFRYEKKQAARLREFHQFGIESFGSKSPLMDAQIIGVAHQVLTTLGVRDIRLEINSIGCPDCRKEYQKALLEYFTARKEQLCETCHERLDKNPMRIIDCKEPGCKVIARDAPSILDYLCEECREHFAALQSALDAMGIACTVNPTIVRGLDYYTKTVFEFVAQYRGEDVTVCGGGRYDGLIAQLGGQDTPALGFGMGLERVLMVMEEQGVPFPPAKTCDIYIGSMGAEGAAAALRLASCLRRKGIWAECDVMDRSVKAQMKYAGKIGAKYTVILGDAELEAGAAAGKNMATGEGVQLPLEEQAFLGAVSSLLF